MNQLMNAKRKKNKLKKWNAKRKKIKLNQLMNAKRKKIKLNQLMSSNKNLNQLVRRGIPLVLR